MKTAFKIILNSIYGVGIFSSGYLISKKIHKPKKVTYVGALRVDNSIKDEPTKIFLELETDPNELVNSDYVNLKVIKENYLKDNTQK